MDSCEMKRNVCTCTPRLVCQSAGIILILLGAILSIFWPTIFEYILSRELVLSPTSKSFEQWKKPSVPLYLDIYLFNWTNSEDFHDETAKPILNEIGPYRFREIRDKKNITFNDHNSTVSYRTFSTFYFDEDGSNGTLDDVVTQLNIVAVGASAQALNMDYVKRKHVSLGLNVFKQELTTSKAVREILFEGYVDDMVLLGQEGLIEGFDAQDIPYDRIGWFYLRNATDKLSGTYNVHTGESDISKLGTIQNYNHLNRNKYYSGECAKLFGSTGELFPPERLKDSIALFTPDMCRSIPFDYEKEVEVHGVTGYRYKSGLRAVDNGTKFPENSCFYENGDGSKVPSGVMNISSCRYGSPVFMSFPHYYAADPFYLNEVQGLEASKEKHESYITLEPMTGAPLEVTIRFQANFLVRPVEELSIFQDVPKIFIPAMWFEQKFVMDSDMARQIRIAVNIPLIGRMVGFAMLAIGAVLILIASCIAFMQSRRRAARQKMEINLGDSIVGARLKLEGSPLLNRLTKPQIIQLRKHLKRPES